jgi:hypothetical protein
VELEMENALRNAVVQSLAELAKVVNPDAKTLNALFRSLALLDKSSHHVKLNPSLQVTSLPIIFQFFLLPCCCRVLGSTPRGDHSLLYFAYTWVRDLFIGGVIYLAKKIIR